MAKIMLVEDDNNLREIYEARLLAEGHQIVSAKDGEEALALAVKEKPELIISDVMMPKISGFDMLDILRSTPETKDTKVIMMTALSQAEDKSRADKLGADRYLVKSQVTLEDVAKAARDVLKGEDDNMPPSTDPTTNSPTPINPDNAPPEPPAPAPVDPAQPATDLSVPSSDPPIPTPITEPPAPEPSVAPVPEPPAPAPVDPAPTTPLTPDLTQSTKAEEATVDSQIKDFLAQVPTTAPPPAPTPANNVSPQEPAAVLPDSTPPAVTTTPIPVTQPEEEKLSDGLTNEAADNAAKLADAVNDLLEKSPAPDSSGSATAPAPQAEVQTPTVPEQRGGQKVIQPLDNPIKAPDLDDLLAKEEEQTATPPPPVNTVIGPDGTAVTPPTPTGPSQTPNPGAPGNVIQPGSDPNSIAL